MELVLLIVLMDTIKIQVAITAQLVILHVELVTMRPETTVSAVAISQLDL